MTKEEWIQQLGDPENIHKPAFAYVQDDPALPRILILGDSISIGYTPIVRNLLKNKVNLHRAPENCGSSARYIEKLSTWLRDETWDGIHFNCGLHDIRRLTDAKPDINAEVMVLPEAYETHLQEIVKRLKQASPKVIWASTTPVGPNAAGRRAGDEIQYNQIAHQVMTRNQTPINDLHGYVLPDIDQYRKGTWDVHYTEAGYAHLGQEVATRILSHWAL